MPEIYISKSIVKYLMASEQTTEYQIHNYKNEGIRYNDRLGYIGATLEEITRSLVAQWINREQGRRMS